MTRAFSTHRQQLTMTMDFIKLLDSHLQGYPSMITMTFTVGMASTIAKKVEPKQTADDCEWWYFFFEGKLLPMNEDPQHLHLSLPCLNRSMDSNEWWVQTCYEQHFACEIQQQLIQLLLIHCRCFCFFLCNYIGANTFLFFSLNYYSYAMHTSTLHCFATYSKPLFFANAFEFMQHHNLHSKDWNRESMKRASHNDNNLFFIQESKRL